MEEIVQWTWGWTETLHHLQQKFMFMSPKTKPKEKKMDAWGTWTMSVQTKKSSTRIVVDYYHGINLASLKFLSPKT